MIPNTLQVKKGIKTSFLNSYDFRGSLNGRTLTERLLQLGI